MHLVPGRARATVTFSICHRNPNPKRPAYIASVPGDGHQYCASLEPIVQGTVIHDRPNIQYMVATVTPTRPGRVDITSADFTYRTGRQDWLRRGTDHAGLSVAGSST
jgi:hypothetical protein